MATLRKDNENDFSSLVVVRTKIKEHLYKPNLQEILCKEFSHFAFLVIQNRQFHFLACSYNLHFSQKHHCNDNCNDFSDFNDITAALDKLIMSYDETHYHFVLRGAIMLHQEHRESRSEAARELEAFRASRGGGGDVRQR